MLIIIDKESNLTYERHRKHLPSSHKFPLALVGPDKV